MLIAILGIIILIVGIVLKRTPEPGSHFANIVRNVGLIVVFLGIALSSVKVINAGQVGVQVLFGKVQDNILESGMHFINPVVEVDTFDVRTQNYTMSARENEGQVQGDDAIKVLSSDGLEVTIDLSVLYRVNPARAPFIL